MDDISSTMISHILDKDRSFVEDMFLLPVQMLMRNESLYPDLRLQ